MIYILGALADDLSAVATNIAYTYEILCYTNSSFANNRGAYTNHKL